MHFLPDVFIPCDTCKGARYNRETLEIRFKNKNIADVLDMTVDEGCEFFENIQSIRSKLITLKHVGLGYMKITPLCLYFNEKDHHWVRFGKCISIYL